MLWIDLVFLTALTVVYPVFSAWQFPKFLRQVAETGSPARIAGYRETIGALWGFAIVGTIIWFTTGRSGSDLGLGVPGGGAFWAALALTLAFAVLMLLQIRSTRDSEPAREKLREQFGRAGLFLPHSVHELVSFYGVSITAAITEELLFRGYLMAVLSGWLGAPFAVIGSSLLFAFAHSYAGWNHAIRAGVLGLVFAVVYVWTGSLWVPMLLHAVVDISAGHLALLVYGDDDSDSGGAAERDAARSD